MNEALITLFNSCKTLPTSKTPKIHNQAVKSILELVINSTYLYTTVPTNKTISGMFA